MATYIGLIEVTTAGTSGGQEIVNTFYYGNDEGGAFEFNDAFMATFAAAWLSLLGETFLGEQTTRYTLNTIEVRAISLQGVVISENAVELAVNLPGDIDAATPGPGLAAIITIKTVSVASEGSRNLKRSYLAWGPVPKDFLTDVTGELTLTAKAAYANIAAMIADVLVVGGLEYQPVRVGRTDLADPPGLGTILSVSVQPFPQPRKSRFTKPSGS